MQSQYTPSDKDIQRFWKKVDRSGGEGACWNWQGFTDNGYGKFKINGKSEFTHRFSYQIKYGDIPDGLLVCHKCDNRKCVNPAHFFLGTHKQNSGDMVEKGRVAKGERHGNAKLTSQQVQEIRDRYAAGNISQRKLAKQYNISYTRIHYIVKNKHWKS